jgi:hypothetical protein
MFCPKCGKEIPNQAVFCPKCGASLQAAGSQPNPDSVPPTESKNKLVRAMSIASPTQKTAGKVYICILLVNLILAGLWLSDTFVWNAPEISRPVSLFTLFQFVQLSAALLSITCALGFLSPVISSLFLTRHMLKQDRKVNGSLLSWLYLIWVAGVLAFLLKSGNNVAAEDGGRVDLSLFGWLYVVCCAVLLVLLVSLTVLHFKAAKERKTQPNPQ